MKTTVHWPATVKREASGAVRVTPLNFTGCAATGTTQEEALKAVTTKLARRFSKRGEEGVGAIILRSWTVLVNNTGDGMALVDLIVTFGETQDCT